ncbi:TrmO family methyltransferase [Candidatus Amarobacter glycogenicus]|uniref:TrmO family methyltransferase domain-containing protein n=1 Tax=Candidatus Amarobacter glycogenicus TaxID=3140699 RepID=UPI002A173E74|nr:SAM-dependent methyltransferase [Dehalococcoidia bacterium]
MRALFRRRRDDEWDRPPAPAEVTLQAIGFVRNGVAKPRPRGWDRVESRLEFLPEHTGRLEGIERYSHALIVAYLDIAAGAPEKPEMLTLASGLRYGILATRSQLRPNHLGVSVATIVGHDGATVLVRGLDAIDGTPILDIKPYLPEYDSVPDARIPGD